MTTFSNCRCLQEIDARKSINLSRIALSGVLGGMLASCGSENDQTSSPEQPTPRVEVVSTARETFDTSRQWPGTMEPLRIYEIMAPENGRIIEFHMDAGVEITAGEMVAKMRFPDADARSTDLAARLELLKKESERLKTLAADRAASESAVAAAEIELLAAQAELRGIEAILGEGELKAPADGWVLETMAVAGSSVVEEAVLARLADASSIGMRLNIPNTEIHYFDESTKLSAITRTGTQHEIHRIIHHGSAGANATIVELWLNPETARESGTVNIRYHTTREALAIPWSAVATDDDRTWVALLTDENRIQRRDIRPGATTGTMVEVLDGLEQGDQIVLYQPRSHGEESMVDPVQRNEKSASDE